jgi:restriction system protein
MAEEPPSDNQPPPKPRGVEQILTAAHDAQQDYVLHAEAGRYRARGFAAAFQSNAFQDDAFQSAPGPLLQAQLIVTGGATAEGVLVEATAIPWFEWVKRFQRDPGAVHEIDWRQWEELIAGAYTEAFRGQPCEVILTPRSGDRGRDVIVTLPGIGSIRYFDQVKAYAAHRVVTLDEVHSMLGALVSHQNVSKGVITTTSKFAPGVYDDPGLKQLMPHRLELKPRDVLLPWLSELAAKRST